MGKQTDVSLRYIFDGVSQRDGAKPREFSAENSRPRRICREEIVVETKTLRPECFCLPYTMYVSYGRSN
jgi:hypothetical protein